MGKGMIVIAGLALALVATVLPAAHAAGQVYSWVDAKGQRHYGDPGSAPQNAKSVKVRVSKAATADAATTADAPADVAANPELASDANTEAAACSVARSNRKLLGDPKQDVLSEDGKTVLDAQARAQRMALADKRVEAYCNVLGNGEAGSNRK